MAGILSSQPFDFVDIRGRQLQRILAGMFPLESDAIAVSEPFGVDPLTLPPNQAPIHLWRIILQKAAIAGTTRALVESVRAMQPRNRNVEFLDDLIADANAASSPEPRTTDGGAVFDDKVTSAEALLFADDLTMPTGEMRAFIDSLSKVLAHVPSVCLLRVTNDIGQNFFGTGFRISSDCILTNHHVLVPERRRASRIVADFGFDVDETGKATIVTSLVGDSSSVVTSAEDDWGVVRVAGLNPDWPIVNLGDFASATRGEPAYILQHPAGRAKRIGFIRNTVSDVTDKVIHYLTDTQGGSSGSPVFDGQGRIMALHHAGGSPTKLVGKPPLSKNEGIRISRVLDGLKAKGILP